jgi:hypothetical protein
VDRVAALTERLLDHVRDHEPVGATRLGLPERDADLPDLSLPGLEAQERSLGDLEAAILLEAGALPRDPSGAVREAAGDLQLLLDEVRWRRTELTDRPRLAHEPLAALELVTAGISELLRETSDPDERRRRVTAAVARARRVPAMLEQAGRLLVGGSAPSFSVLEERLPRAIELVRDLLPRRAAEVGLEVDAARDAGEYAAEGLEAFGALVDELIDDRRLDWRVGPVQHERALRLAVGTTMDAQTVEDRARIALTETRAEMLELAASSWQHRFPGVARPADDDALLRTVMAHVADAAVPAAGLIAELRRAVEEVAAFTRAWGVLDVPSDDELVVGAMPEELRGLAVAHLLRPPPFGPARPSELHLAPVDERWDRGRAHSYLREYHPAALRSVAVHEAYPGHFLQLTHAAEHPRLVRRLVTRPVFVEGWAVMVERLLLDEGFGEEGTSRVPLVDLALTQRRMQLRVAANALLDLGLHAASMTDEDALALLTGAALQEEVEARGKLRRAKVTSGQLSAYFTGASELEALRRRQQARLGAAFDLRTHLRSLLAHGSPTVALVAAALDDAARAGGAGGPVGTPSSGARPAATPATPGEELAVQGR